MEVVVQARLVSVAFIGAMVVTLAACSSQSEASRPGTSAASIETSPAVGTEPLFSFPPQYADGLDRRTSTVDEIEPSHVLEREDSYLASLVRAGLDVQGSEGVALGMGWQFCSWADASVSDAIDKINQSRDISGEDAVADAILENSAELCPEHSETVAAAQDSSTAASELPDIQALKDNATVTMVAAASDRARSLGVSPNAGDYVPAIHSWVSDFVDGAIDGGLTVEDVSAAFLWWSTTSDDPNHWDLIEGMSQRHGITYDQAVTTLSTAAKAMDAALDKALL